MATVFADTFYFVALLNRADQSHARALHYASTHRESIITTAWVLMEFADTFAKPPARERAAILLRSCQRDTRFRVLPPSWPQFERGLELYEARPDKAWSLTDCMSFGAMHDEGLTDALTGDHHFEQAGFVALLI